MWHARSNTFVCTVQAALCKHVCGLDQEYLEAMGDRMQEHLVENVVGDIDLSISALFELFGTILLLFALFITLLTLSWQLTMLLCCVLPAYVFVSNKGVRACQPVSPKPGLLSRGSEQCASGFAASQPAYDTVGWRAQSIEGTFVRSPPIALGTGAATCGPP